MRCRVTIFLLVGWVSLSVVGYLGKDSIYKKYAHDVQTTPYFVLVLEGIHDGIYPWSSEDADFWEDWSTTSGDTPEGGIPSDGTESIGVPESLAGTELPGGTESLTGTETLVGTGAEMTGTEENSGGTEALQPREFVTVDESYFDDAVFIGDSRTVGLHDYSGLDKATFYATVGLNVYDMWTEKFCEVEGKKVTLEEALSAQQFKKVYFQIGINEMGRGTLDSFIQAYSASVEKFKQLQPDAIIYVQGIMRVAREKSETDKIFNNPGINARNEKIAQLADGQTVFYIDVNEVVCDEQGNLKEELTFDQLHLLGSKYDIWVEFLKSKGIEMEDRIPDSQAEDKSELEESTSDSQTAERFR
ncbi:MAG: acylhydrolase [Roseburia sp.]|nr:acylhydrolase [Roseburia sp.]